MKIHIGGINMYIYINVYTHTSYIGGLNIYIYIHEYKRIHTPFSNGLTGYEVGDHWLLVVDLLKARFVKWTYKWAKPFLLVRKPTFKT